MIHIGVGCFLIQSLIVPYLKESKPIFYQDLFNWWEVIFKIQKWSILPTFTPHW
jgi:hypothetical protein